MIGVFDSGLGGLTIFKYFLADLPEYDFIYLGDNARAPYGSRSQETIYRYTREAVDFLFAKNCKLIIIACNTASAQALRRIQQEYLPEKYPDRKVLGVIRPLVEEAVKEINIEKIGVIGTRATIESKVYTKEFKKLNPKIKIFEQSAPLLVPLIEEGWVKSPETRKILKKYLLPLKTKKVRALILACTHYPFLMEEFKKIMPKNCKISDPGKIVSSSLADYLKKHKELGIKKKKKAKVEYFTTGDISRFKAQGKKFIEKKINNIKKIEL